MNAKDREELSIGLTVDAIQEIVDELKETRRVLRMLYMESRYFHEVDDGNLHDTCGWCAAEFFFKSRNISLDLGEKP